MLEGAGNDFLDFVRHVLDHRIYRLFVSQLVPRTAVTCFPHKVQFDYALIRQGEKNGRPLFLRRMRNCNGCSERNHDPVSFMGQGIDSSTVELVQEAHASYMKLMYFWE